MSGVDIIQYLHILRSDHISNYHTTDLFHKVVFFCIGQENSSDEVVTAELAFIPLGLSHPSISAY